MPGTGPSPKAPLLRRPDQMVVGGLLVGALASMAGYWLVAGGHRGELIEIDRAEPLAYQFQVNINEAQWPELSQLPGVGEVLARRIVESRSEQGPYADLHELLRVEGIGPLTLERMKPYLLPLSGVRNVAGTETAVDFPVP